MVSSKLDVKKNPEVKFWQKDSFRNCIIFIVYAFIFTLLLSSKHFFFRSIIDENNVARRDIIAEKTIEVTDTFKTEQRKKELVQKLDPIMRPAEDMFIINDFDNTISYLYQIKSSDLPYNDKFAKIVSTIDLADSSREEFLATFFLNANDDTINPIVNKAKHVLKKILATGISDKDVNESNLNVLISRNIDKDITRNQFRIISTLIEQVILPNMLLDEEATDKARKSVADSVVPIKVVFEKGDKIIAQGERVNKVKKDALLKAGYSIIQINAKGVTGIFAIFLIGIFAIYNYLKLFELQYLNKKHISLITILSLILIFVAVILPPDWSVFILPIPAFVILLSVFTNPRTSFFITVILTVLISSALWLSAARLSVFIIVALFTSIYTSKINFTKRFQLIKIGFEISIVMILCILSMYLLQLCLTDMATKWFLPDIVFGFVNCVFSGIIALGMMPVLENMTGIITPYGLSELCDANQPLLKRLQFEAPGTFSHSTMLSTLAETAAEAIGANAVLARVGALYHDIGKLKRPLFFIENQNYFGIENPHCKLNPRLSKMVIISHVKDGLDIANEYNIPDVIKDFIAQHHGTTLASYFYTQALKQEGTENVVQEQFRYPGPRPKTKETAILMIADTVESASRTLKEYSQEELERMINKLIVEKLNDGQLSECPLSMKDLKAIAEALGKSLRAAHHQRIKYHDNIIEELENRSKQKVIPDDKVLPENLKKDDKKDEN
ncbi:MAG: HDIG domain-containing protein [Candidatus Gastranaerophilales bacterium]|nr:HDIG domain-containing protein [Candidatus Gastranaerophilales bacterium]